MINLSSPCFFVGRLVLMNVLVTSRTIISRLSYTSIISVKNCFQWCCMASSILPWQQLSSWFYIEHNSFFICFCFALLLWYHYSLLITSLLLLSQVLNINRIKQFAYKVGPSPWSANHALLIWNVLVPYVETHFWKACDRVQASIRNKSSVWLDYIELRTRLNQFEMFEEHGNCLSRWKQCCSRWKQCWKKTMYK